MKFMTDEWLTEYANVLNEDSFFADSTASLDGVVVMEVLPSEGFLGTGYLVLRISRGKCVRVESKSSMGTARPDFVFSGTFTHWKKVVTGKMDLNQALFVGEIILKNEEASNRLWRDYLRLTFALGRCMTRLSTDF